MRISDWSSDVCSSDLSSSCGAAAIVGQSIGGGGGMGGDGSDTATGTITVSGPVSSSNGGTGGSGTGGAVNFTTANPNGTVTIATSNEGADGVILQSIGGGGGIAGAGSQYWAQTGDGGRDRQRVVEGKRGSVRVDLRGRRYLKKK